MSGFHVKPGIAVAAALICAALTLPALAQDAPPSRAASFVDASDAAATTPAPDFSGLAAAPELVAPPLASSKTPPASTSAPPVTAPGPEIDVAPLPNVSPESVGLSGGGTLGADMWQGTPRAVALPLLSMIDLTAAPVLNDLARRLLTTAAVPPLGDATDVSQSLTSLRVRKLIAFADGVDAWALAKNAQAQQLDDDTLHQAAVTALASGDAGVCGQIPALAQSHPAVDWQEARVVCQMRANDTKAAQVALDVLRAAPARDDIFLQIADKNVLAGGKNLPGQLTPLTPELLAALRLTGVPLPEDLYGHPDFSLAPALLSAAAREDVARLGLAERAAERGVINAAQLKEIYQSVAFKPDELAAPLTAIESGSRLRALLVQAAVRAKDPQQRVAYAVKFVQSARSQLLNGAGAVVAGMAGDITPDATAADNALPLAQIYMLGGNAAARDWLKLVKRDFSVADFRALWPQFVLAGLEPDADYTGDLKRWVDAELATADPHTDNRAARDDVAAALLLFDATAHAVPDALWARVLPPPRDQARVAWSPVLLERLRAASAAGRRAETVLLCLGLAGEGDISLPAAVEITRALWLVGLRSDAMSFARHIAFAQIQGDG